MKTTEFNYNGNIVIIKEPEERTPEVVAKNKRELDRAIHNIMRDVIRLEKQTMQSAE